MSGVEIEFSVDGGESGVQGDDEGGDGTETGEAQPQPATAEARPSRIQGKANSTERKSTLLRFCIVPSQLMQLLGHAGLSRMFASHGNGAGGITLQIDEDELDDGFGGLRSRLRRRRKSARNKFPAVPSEVGQRLMDSGIFGTSEYYRDNLRKRSERLARKLMSRELGNDRNHSSRATSAISQV